MSNPYQPPSFDPKYFQDQHYAPQPGVGAGLGMVSQIRVVAILNCVQGGLELLMGSMLAVLAGMVPVMFSLEREGGNGGGPSQDVQWFMIGSYSVMSGATLIAGLLRLYAGIQNFRFRGRTLGIVSFSVGLLSILGCYCTPTTIAVFVYGLIVYLNPAVKAAFEMGEKGMSADQILSSFVVPAPTPLKPQ